MDTATFWHMIERAKAESNGDCDHQAQLLEQRLAQLLPEEIQGFDRILSQFMAQSYNDDIWAAAYIINSGCSDDLFEYFRGWLIAQGEAIFYAALQDPDSLAAIVAPSEPPHDYECEALLYVAMGAYEASTSKEMPLEEYGPYEPNGRLLERDSSEQGKIWIDGDLSETYARKHFPKLWAKFEW